MTRNAYADLCLHVQAVRRHLEGLRSPLAPAIGVAAFTYTHQLANVLRVLTDVRVRHLLADEVGLGKTVQALMILNALRYQRPDLKALVVVPDRLVTQWRDEIMTRAHTAPFDDSKGDKKAGTEARQYIHLVWEEKFRRNELALTDVDPASADVLIVDELHRLRSDLQDRIVRVAGSFEHLLILTATPRLQDPARHAQLFALLEPERTAIARWKLARSERGAAEQLSVTDDLSFWPEWAVTGIVEELLERDRRAARAAADDTLEATAMSQCAYRRVIRTRRADYSGVLPRRRHCPLVVEPLGAEADRQSLMWRYFRFLGELTRAFDPVLLAKRVILSPPSLEQRVDFLRRKDHDREGLLQCVKPLVHRSHGDSRADALVDLLAEIWANDPEERVLVAAQDNLTVDYLFGLVTARLPEVGPLDRRRPLEAALLRQGQKEEMLEDLAGYGNETAMNLEAFQRGEALVLFAPERAQIGLNLQRARVLVLYSVPWKPEEVEQWIGRLDRIGNAAAFSSDGEAKTIDVFTIVQRGLVDEKVVEVLKRFQVFEQNVNLDGEHLSTVADSIESAALRHESVSWTKLEDTTRKLAAEDEVQELASELRPYLPWSVDKATSERKRVETLAPAGPVLNELPVHASTGPKSWDRAFEGMLKLLARTSDYHIRWNNDPDGGRFKSLWYQFGERTGWGEREVLSKVVFSFGADPGVERSPRHAHAFITRRGDIGSPPRRSVELSIEGGSSLRPLRFLNFGDPLHDELVAGWLPNENDPLEMDVSFSEDHSIWQHGEPGLYLLRVLVLDPASLLLSPESEKQALETIARAAGHTTGEQLLRLMSSFEVATRSALASDARWLRGQLAATMSLEVRRHREGQWVQVHAEERQALLNPLADNRLPHSSSLSASQALFSSAVEELKRLRGADSTAAPLAWSHRTPHLEQALRTRELIVREERHDALALSEEQLLHAEGVFRVASERGNKGQITRAENARKTAVDNHEMNKVFWQEREGWLGKCKQAVQQTLPHEYMTAVLRARRIP